MNYEPIAINEIFYSIQGESSFAGLPCSFVRLAGCNHGCRFCDTGYANETSVLLDQQEIIARATRYRTKLIEITGGEPLQQPGVYDLMRQLCDGGFTVLLETGGFMPVDHVDPRVHKIIDIKPPSSGVSDRNHLENLRVPHLVPDNNRHRFEFKFVIADRNDYLWSRALLEAYQLPESVTVLMGVIFNTLEPGKLAEWILEDQLPVRFQLQLHKYLWHPERRGV